MDIHNSVLWDLHMDIHMNTQVAVEARRGQHYSQFEYQYLQKSQIPILLVFLKLSGVGVVSPVKGHHVSPKEGRLISLVGGRPVSLTCDTEVSSVFSEHGGGDGAITHE